MCSVAWAGTSSWSIRDFIMKKVHPVFQNPLMYLKCLFSFRDPLSNSRLLFSLSLLINPPELFAPCSALEAWPFIEDIWYFKALIEIFPLSAFSMNKRLLTWTKMYYLKYLVLLKCINLPQILLTAQAKSIFNKRASNTVVENILDFTAYL